MPYMIDKLWPDATAYEHNVNIIDTNTVQPPLNEAVNSNTDDNQNFEFPNYYVPEIKVKARLERHTFIRTRHEWSDEQMKLLFYLRAYFDNSWKDINTLLQLMFMEAPGNTNFLVQPVTDGAVKARYVSWTKEKPSLCSNVKTISTVAYDKLIEAAAEANITLFPRKVEHFPDELSHLKNPQFQSKHEDKDIWPQVVIYTTKNLSLTPPMQISKQMEHKPRARAHHQTRATSSTPITSMPLTPPATPKKTIPPRSPKSKPSRKRKASKAPRTPNTPNGFRFFKKPKRHYPTPSLLFRVISDQSPGTHGRSGCYPLLFQASLAVPCSTATKAEDQELGNEDEDSDGSLDCEETMELDQDEEGLSVLEDDMEPVPSPPSFVHLDPSYDDAADPYMTFHKMMQMHLKRQKFNSPFLSTTSSLIQAIKIALEKSAAVEAHTNIRILIIDYTKLEKTHVFHGYTMRHKLEDLGLFVGEIPNWWWGTYEYIVYNFISGDAIINDITLQDLLHFLRQTQNAQIKEFLRLDYFEPGQNGRWRRRPRIEDIRQDLDLHAPRLYNDSAIRDFAKFLLQQDECNDGHFLEALCDIIKQNWMYYERAGGIRLFD